MLHTLNLGCSFITLRDPCNNKLPRCDIAWLRVRLFNSENRGVCSTERRRYYHK